jgi:acetyltransferase-like isoleucine patch superfamily enzyme
MIDLRTHKNFYKFNKWLLGKKYKNQLLKLGKNVDLKGVSIGYNNFISSNTKLVDVEIGDFSYVSNNSQLINAEIGKFCSIGDGVKIGLGFHPTERVSTHPSFYSNNKIFKCFADSVSFKEYRPTIVGNDVWIGSNVMIFGGVKIGDGAILAGGAIITKDVEPYTIVGGNPAKLIKHRFDADVVKKLLDFKWWDKDLSWIQQNYNVFNDTEAFLKFIGNLIDKKEKV